MFLATDPSRFAPFSSARALRCYRLRQAMSLLLQLTAWALLLLKVFERPLWTFHTPGWEYKANYPRSGIALIAPETACAVKLPLMLGLYLLMSVCLYLCMSVCLYLFLSLLCTVVLLYSC